MQLISFLDSSTINFINSIRTPALTFFFTAITYLGEWSVALIMMALISTFFIIKKKVRYDFVLWFSVLGSLAAAFALKHLINRPRPAEALIHETSSSFPSAHAAISIALYGFAAYLLISNSQSRSAKIILALAAVFLAALLGFSRLYLGVHYFSDVVAGYLIGLIWLTIGIYVSKKTKDKSNPL